MKGKIFLLSLICSVLIGLNGFAQNEKHVMTIEDVLTVKSVYNTQISPDGQWILFGIREANLKENRYNSDFWMVKSLGNEQPIRMTYHLASEYSWEWSPNGEQIAFISDRDKKPQIYFLSLKGGEAQQFTESETGVISFHWSPKGNKIAYLAKEPLSKKEEKMKKEKADAKVVDQDFRYTHLWIFDVYSKESKQITKGNFQVDNFHWSPNGEEIVFSHRPTPKVPDYYHSDISVVSIVNGQFRPVIQRKGLDSNPKFSPNGKKIAFISQDEDTVWYSNTYICVYDRKDKEIKNISKKFDNTIGEYRWSENGKSFYFVGGQKTNIYIWNISSKGGRPKIVSDIAGVNNGFSISDEGELISFIHQSGDTPPNVYVTSLDDFTPQKITSMHTYLDSFKLSTPEIVRWSGPGDMQIEGLLYKPIGYQSGQKVPLLTKVHGGPAGYYTNSFSMGYVYPYQVFAGKGYAILLPNPRGSGNYGYEFRKANFQDWGGDDYEDIMNGIDNLIEMGFADPEKLGIMGWSYGGFMTSWIITQTDRFEVASVGAGVTNLFSFVGQTDIPEFMYSYWGEWPWNNPELYRSRSALYHIEDASTPTLIQHGEEDVRVPIAQGRELYMGLKKNGVETKFVIYPRQPHGIREPNLLKDAMRRNVAWMDQWILEKE